MKREFLFLLLSVNLLTAPKSNAPDLLIIGHRGAAGHAPENTIVSVKTAEELGANVIEIDLRQTKDGIPVAIHDPDVDRTTNGCGNVSDFTFNEIQQLDAGSWFDEKFKCVRIPSLQQVIDALNDTTILIIEFKGGLGEYEQIEENTLKIIYENNFTGRVILKSFDPNQLNKVRKLNPGIPLLYVYALRIPWLNIIIDTGVTLGSVYEFNTKYLQPHRLFLTESFVEEAHVKGVKVIAWGVNELSEIKTAIDAGVDGIETDYPDRVYEYFNMFGE